MIQRDEFSVRAIVVGSDPQLVRALSESVGDAHAWQFDHVVDVDTALALLGQKVVSAVILCVRNALTLAQALRFLRRVDRSQVPTLVLCDAIDPADILQLYQQGAAECLQRPLNVTRLCTALDLLTAGARVQSRLVQAPAMTVSEFGSHWYEKMMEQVRTVAGLDTTVLITGETGTGKTRLSRTIHGMSARRDQPFLAVNCGALSESLLDSELFGHVKGAFTGADRDRTGKLAQCGAGTLLLDEVDTLTPTAQVKLLQVVEERVYQPLGAPRFEPLRARLIVASNRLLQTEVDAGRFRSDLYYRLNVMAFELPPLRRRCHEIEALATQFAGEFAQQHGFTSSTIDPRALAALEAYEWPGNIRELRNVMERAVILSMGSTIDLSHLPLGLQPTSTPSASPNVQERSRTDNPLADARFAAERELLLRALRRNDNNRSKTAHDLGISRVALYKRLRKLHIM